MCTPSTIPYPTFPGIQFTSLSTSLVSNVTTQIPESFYVNNGALDVQGVSYCHVITTYTHTGATDNVTVDVFLPTKGWNGRMQGVGGGGYSAGGLTFPLAAYTMLGAVAEGYSAVTTDAGHASTNPYDWILTSPGHVNYQLLENFGSTSLNELSVIGKAITKSYFGEAPHHSYFNGCSQGGRQGMKLAEKYPTAFDGIAASAPALDLTGVGVADLWPQIVMKTLGKYSKNCELLAITEAAIEYCDANDGLIDGVILDPDACNFDPYSVVGKPISCNDTGIPETISISTTAAIVANATWTGAQKSDGSPLWWGLKKGATLVEEDIGFTTILGLATTTCSQNGTCVGKPADVVVEWIQLLLKKDPNFDVSTVTAADFERLFQASSEEYKAICDVEPNFGAFRDTGGKIISYHGLADTVVPPNSTTHFYDQVAAKDINVHDYYRIFEAPGLAHCYTGSGGYYPAGIFKALVSWVESGVAPDKLPASTPAQNGTVHNGVLCPYPKKVRYNGLSSSSMNDDFYCYDGTDLICEEKTMLSNEL
ncbi:tannase and feruloyl esterase [Annulohypoxylon truncatum]|uniref:tannase and feruloyl esterase n=1 Tax=Annulohypoxylon truncatum TaxID=327061 RepID=UPI0020085731|nr:tannase and feruloyl esterase [Annulohypoxylon truncatum]KAI1210575.1 tannase and feruloyl esterase [Annulohypoxylon truncatum]